MIITTQPSRNHAEQIVLAAMIYAPELIDDWTMISAGLFQDELHRTIARHAFGDHANNGNVDSTPLWGRTNRLARYTDIERHQRLRPSSAKLRLTSLSIDSTARYVKESDVRWALSFLRRNAGGVPA